MMLTTTNTPTNELKTNTTHKLKQLRDFVTYCVGQNIFIHQGHGQLDNYKSTRSKTKTINISNFIQTFYRDKEENSLFIDDVFINHKITDVPSDIGYKPCKCVWWSNGSWLFDPYHDVDTDDDLTQDLTDTTDVFITTEPINILKILSKDDFVAFCETYCERVLSQKYVAYNILISNFKQSTDYKFEIYRNLCDVENVHVYTEHFLSEHPEINKTDFYAFLESIIQTNVDILTESIHLLLLKQYPQIEPSNLTFDEHKYGHVYSAHIKSRLEFTIMYFKYSVLQKIIIEPEYEINYKNVDWSKVKSSGYFGIYFGFRKIYDLGFSWKDFMQYLWHCGFDVESLIIWDNRAYNNIYSFNLSLC